MSLYVILGIPDEVGIILFTISFALMLTPFLSGVDLGFFKVPDLSLKAKRRLKVIGGPLVVVSLLPFLPLFRAAQAESDSRSDRLDQAPPREYFYGTWYTSNFERGREVELSWTINADGTTSYFARVDGQELSLTSEWSYAEGLFYEETEQGTAKSIVEVIDADTFRLTIVEDETAAKDSRGVTRTYRRVDD